MDFIGPLKISEGKKYILVAVDVATGWPDMWPTAEAMGEVVLQALKELEAHFGKLHRLKTDNGSHFKNVGIKQWCEKGNVEYRFGIPYHPQGQGKVEHLNQEIKRKLNIAQEVFGKGWFQQIPWVLQALQKQGGNGKLALSPK